ncbi:MAG: hypothetical protein VYC34_10425 [Planctomycetota bacterium]|nr:hypothetical protein [Planctomycetota bacterium]
MRFNLGFAAAAGAALAMSGVASADLIEGGGQPDLVFQVFLNGEMAYDGRPQGTPMDDNGTYNFDGAWQNSDFMVDWDINANADPFIIANTVLTNISNATQNFTVMAMIPIFPAVTPSSVVGGSIQGGLTADGDGGTLSSVGNSPIYRAMVDGGFLGAPGELFINRSISAGAFGSDSFDPSESFGDPIPSAPGPAVLNSIGIRLDFTLTPGDQASFTSVFVVEIPGPGALALFGVAGLAVSRRRR